MRLRYLCYDNEYYYEMCFNNEIEETLPLYPDIAFLDMFCKLQLLLINKFQMLLNNTQGIKQLLRAAL